MVFTLHERTAAWALLPVVETRSGAGSDNLYFNSLQKGCRRFFFPRSHQTLQILRQQALLASQFP